MDETSELLLVNLLLLAMHLLLVTTSDALVTSSDRLLDATSKDERGLVKRGGHEQQMWRHLNEAKHEHHT